MLGIKSKVRGLKVSMQSNGVSTSKRDKAIDVVVSKEFWLFLALYGGSSYVFVKRTGGESIMMKAAIAGLLISLISAPVAYLLVTKYVHVKKRLVAAFDAEQQNHDAYVTGPETARELEEESDERVGRRYDKYGNKVSAIQDVVDAKLLDIKGLGPRETPDDDALIADPKRQLQAWRDTIMDTFRQVRDELAGRPAQQAKSEYETANQLIVDFEQSVSRYGEKQEEAKREMSNYEGTESDKDKPEQEDDESLGELARQIVDDGMDEPEGGDHE